MLVHNGSGYGVGFYGLNKLNQNTKMVVDIDLIYKYIERIKIDYPEDDKLMIDLQQFAQELVKNCSIPDVVGQSEQLKAEVFTLANKLAVAGEGDAAVAMHKIHNSL